MLGYLFHHQEVDNYIPRVELSFHVDLSRNKKGAAPVLFLVLLPTLLILLGLYP